jgi:hypothetical protein
MLSLLNCLHKNLISQNVPPLHTTQNIFQHICKIVKSDYYCRHVCL